MTYASPRQPDELAGLLGFLEDQRRALRAALHGLSDDQARATPIPSTGLSLGGLLKHMVAVERSWIRSDVLREPEDERIRDLEFTLLPDETVQQWMDAWDVEIDHTNRVIPTIDLQQHVPFPVPGELPFNVRWVLLHLIEEAARHAGHADLIREAIDGRDADALRDAAWG